MTAPIPTEADQALMAELCEVTNFELGPMGAELLIAWLHAREEQCAQANIAINAARIKAYRAWLNWNSTDLGEMGKYIKTEYAHNGLKIHFSSQETNPS